MEVNGQFHVPAALSPGEIASGTHWIGGWVDPRSGLDSVEKRDENLASVGNGTLAVEPRNG
jgi:hypothetical protein